MERAEQHNVLSGRETMSEEFTVYDTRTGAILRTGLCPQGQGYRQAIKAWEQSLPGTWLHDDFWHNGSEFVPRQPLAVKIDGTTIYGIPDGATLHCDGKDYGPIDDGTAEFDFNLPGEYRVDIRCVSHINGSVTLVQP